MCGAVTEVTEVEQETQTASRRKPTAGETGPADSSDPAISAISTRAGQTDWTLRVRDNKPGTLALILRSSRFTGLDKYYVNMIGGSEF